MKHLNLRTTMYLKEQIRNTLDSLRDIIFSTTSNYLNAERSAIYHVITSHSSLEEKQFKVLTNLHNYFHYKRYIKELVKIIELKKSYRDILDSIKDSHVFSHEEKAEILNLVSSDSSLYYSVEICCFILQKCAYILFLYSFVEKMLEASSKEKNNKEINTLKIHHLVSGIQYDFEEKFNQNEQSDELIDTSNIDHHISDILENSAKFIQSGILTLDQKLSGGFSIGDTVVITARPGIGKTLFCLNILFKNAERLKEAGKICVYFTPDMSKKYFYRRMLKMMRVGSVDLSDNSNKEERIKMYKSISDAIKQIPIAVSETNYIEEIISYLNYYNKRVGMIVIDYIQIIGSVYTDKAGRNEAIGNAIMKLKRVARKYNATLILAAQVNREYEKISKQDGQMAQASYIRDSGFIEQEADIIIGLNQINIPNVINVRLLKNRNGPLHSTNCKIDTINLNITECENYDN